MISPVGNCLLLRSLLAISALAANVDSKNGKIRQLGKCQQLSEHHCAEGEDHKDVHLAAVCSIVPAGPFC